MPTVEVLDNQAVIIGSNRAARLQPYTKDANAFAPSLDMNPGNSVDVPVFMIGVNLAGQDLGFFDGFTQPMVATIDLDRDSYVGFHYSADDTAVVRMALNSGTVRNHTLPDVASDTFTLNAATQTLTNKTLTSPVIGGDLGVNDDVSIEMGNDDDIVVRLRSATLAANTALTDVLVGTPVAQAIAANSLLVSNVTASGDQAFYANLGGNSLQWLFYDTSASRVYSWPNGTAGFDWTSAAATFASAASTANQVLTVQNTSNAAAASHAYVDIAVGGTISTGDPHVRFTIPSGTSWYAGIDNSGTDVFYLGTGTTVGSSGVAGWIGATSGVSAITRMSLLSDLGATLDDSASARFRYLNLETETVTLAGTTQVTALFDVVSMGIITINQSGGAVTVDKYTGISSVSATAGASVTLTHSSAFRALTGGAAVNVSGYFAEAQTAGTTGNYQYLAANGGTAPVALADHAGWSCIDRSAGNATFAFSTETAVVADATGAFNSKIPIIWNGTNYQLLAIQA